MSRFGAFSLASCAFAKTISGKFHPHINNYKGEDWANYEYPKSDDTPVAKPVEPEGTSQARN